MFSRYFSPVRHHFATGCVVMLFAALLLAIGSAAPAKKPVDKYNKKMAKQEIQLMKKMVDQRQAAINLALTGDLGTTLTATGDVASMVTTTAINVFCRRYAVRMQTEQDKLRSWLRRWHKVNYTPRHQGGDDEDEDTLVGLTGDEFTEALLDQMVGVHMRGIAFEKQADKKGYHPEFKEFAKAAKARDTREVAQIKTWIRLFEADDDDDDDDEDDD